MLVSFVRLRWIKRVYRSSSTLSFHSGHLVLSLFAVTRMIIKDQDLSLIFIYDARQLFRTFYFIIQ